MLFNSLQFPLFFTLVVILYFLLPFKYRWVLLLAASYYFYMCWRVQYAVLLLGSTLIDYFAGLLMYKHPTRAKRKKYLYASLVANLGLLFTFKYFNFFSSSVNEVLQHFNIFTDPITFKLLLPVGISFYTFQSLSYTIDVYKGDREPEKHLGIFALYVSFFPQLVAGPIERSTSLMPQFYVKHNYDYNRVKRGLQLMAWGFFQKVVIADRLSFYVNSAYNNPQLNSGFEMLIATYFFAFQIYCDFAGYSDIAIGAAQVMGYELMQNFNKPYFATSISDFWKRWHISLSTWFRDYLYIPLGGSRVSKSRWHFNVFMVFLTSGLWHGANWTFVIWGGLHGFYMLFSYWTQNLRNSIKSLVLISSLPSLDHVLQIIITFHLVCIGWVFFRANSVSQAFYILKNIIQSIFSLNTHRVIPNFYMALSFGLICMLLTVHYLQSRFKLREWLSAKPALVRWSVYYAVIWSIYLLGQFNEQKFIYFQF